MKQESENFKTDMVLYKQMAKDYWDRWRWELQRRKEEMSKTASKSTACTTNHGLHQINPAYLSDPHQNGKPTEVLLGHGSFSLVYLIVYRGYCVAAKRFRTGAVKDVVVNEALLLSLVNHPYLPFIFGVCTEVEPYQLITQFHGVDSKTVTLHREIYHRREITDPLTWLILCSQLLEVVDYLHTDAHLLHNDIKEDNILLTLDSDPLTASTSKMYHIVLTDFGKVTHIQKGRSFNLSESDKVEYYVKYTHLAPEVINSRRQQTVMGDIIYSIGILFRKLHQRGCFATYADHILLCIIDQCTSADIAKRPTAKQFTENIQLLMK